MHRIMWDSISTTFFEWGAHLGAAGDVVGQGPLDDVGSPDGVVEGNLRGCTRRKGIIVISLEDHCKVQTHSKIPNCKSVGWD